MKNYILTAWKFLIKNKEILIILTLIWIVLFEKFSILILLTGILVSVFIIVFLNRFILDEGFTHTYSLKLGTLIKYYIQLFYEIFASGLKVIPFIISGKAEPQHLTVHTTLSNDTLIGLLTNCITLTAGSVTIEKTGNKLFVLVLDPPSEDEDPREVIPSKIESILKQDEEK